MRTFLIVASSATLTSLVLVAALNAAELYATAADWPVLHALLREVGRRTLRRVVRHLIRWARRHNRRNRKKGDA